MNDKNQKTENEMRDNHTEMNKRVQYTWLKETLAQHAPTFIGMESLCPDHIAFRMRELKEELLLKEDQISYLGDMDKLYSGGSLVMHSFATEVKGYQNTFNPAEVAEVFTVPLEFFLHTDPECYVIRAKVEPGEDFPYERICGGREYRWRSRKEEVCFYQYEGHVIWGLTAKLMRAFADVVRDRETGYEKHV